MAKSGNVAERYATALFELAGDRGLYDAVSADLRNIAESIENSADFKYFINDHILPRAEQVRAISALGKKAELTGLTLNFLGLLASARRLAALPDIITLYKSKLAALRGEHTAEVISATPLRPGQLETLREKLTSKLGGRVALELKVEPALIGGLIVNIGSKMIDSSIRSRLERIGFAMKGSV